MYADDAAIFLNPIKEEIKIKQEILVEFGQASGLITNRSKCAVYPIRCEGINVAEIMKWFPCDIKEFPCTYLGVSLHTRALRRVEVQPLIDKVAARLPTWKGRFLNKSGRLTLVNSILTSIPAYYLTVFALKK